MISLFVLATFLFVYFRNDNKYNFNIDIFYYLIISSIITPAIFVFLSPKIINLSHFISYILFSFFGFFLFSIFFMIYNYLKEIDFKILKKNLFLNLYLIIFLTSFFVLGEQFVKIKNNVHRDDLKRIQTYFEKNSNIDFTKKKLFTNHLTIQNLWLLNGNTNVLVSDAFTNIVPKDNIEYILFNSFKSLGISEENFKNYLLEKKVIFRDPLIMFISNYRYQGNSLYQYEALRNYNLDSIKRIRKTSPFNNQSNILPENEKKLLIKKYSTHQIDNNLKPEIIILRTTELNKNLKIVNNDYLVRFSGENFILLTEN